MGPLGPQSSPYGTQVHCQDRPLTRLEPYMLLACGQLGQGPSRQALRLPRPPSRRGSSTSTNSATRPRGS
eukprot:949169-Alexandrium_andersonii.AAC.1